MFCPPVLHKPFHYPTRFHGKILKDWSIAGKSQLLEPHKMFVPFPYKHMENADESIASNVLITLCEGSGHHRNLRPEPLQKVRNRSAGGEFSTPSTEHSHRGIHIAPKLSQLFTKRILELLQLRAHGFLHISLLPHHIIMWSMHTLKIFFKVLVFRGQSPHTMLNLCHVRPSSIMLRPQLGIDFF
jgi:hypothetical protein